jgi:hypothetical protein
LPSLFVYLSCLRITLLLTLERKHIVRWRFIFDCKVDLVFSYLILYPWYLQEEVCILFRVGLWILLKHELFFLSWSLNSRELLIQILPTGPLRLLKCADLNHSRFLSRNIVIVNEILFLVVLGRPCSFRKLIIVLIPILGGFLSFLTNIIGGGESWPCVTALSWVVANRAYVFTHNINWTTWLKTLLFAQGTQESAMEKLLLINILTALNQCRHT